MEQARLDSIVLATFEANMNSLQNLLKTQLEPLNLITRLYDAAIKGDLVSLHNLVQEDPQILERCIIEKSDRFMQSPLHVAANLGHLEFTIEILRLKPQLAEQHDHSTKSSALHLASMKGHLDVVKKLLEVLPNMCLARDQDCRNPVHVAAISNQLHVLDFLVRMNPFAAQERTNIGETILHLCVKYSQLECLKYSVNAMGVLLNAKDNDGNTVLHLAVLAKQPEAVKFLVANKNMQQNAINKNGLTALDFLIQAGKKNLYDNEIRQTLKRAKAIKAKHVEKKRDRDGKWLNKKRNSLMVVASLIATMAFQVGVNPPGGVTQDKSNLDHHYGLISPSPNSHGLIKAREDAEDLMLTVNTISLVSSFSVVFLLISGLPCKRLFVIVLMITMWVSIVATLWTYFMSLSYYLNITVLDGISTALRLATIWAILVAVFIMGYIFLILIKQARILVRLVKRMMRTTSRYSQQDSSSTAIP